MSAKKLRWSSGRGCVTEGYRNWHIQAEQTRGEPILYFLEGLTFAQEKAAEHIETAFFGRGGVTKVKAAAQQLADMIEASQ